MIQQSLSRNYFIIGLVLLLMGCGATVKPIADNQQIETSEDIAINLVLTGSSTAPEALTYQIKSPPNFGTLSGSAPNLTYTPLVGFVGHASFTFIVNDGVADSDEATIDIAVAPNLENISQKPVPVFLKFGYPTSTTEIHLEWSESLDDTTPTDDIIYEIHIADNDAFYPTPETLFRNVTGVQEAELSGFSAGELVYAKIIAVDANGNRSLETNALPVTVAEQELVTRNDINIFLADEHLENPELDVENGILSFTQIDSELPNVGDYILFNTQVDTAIFRITDVLSPAAKPAFLPNALPTLGTVEFEVAAADFGELMQSGDLNLSISASNGSDVGSRWKNGWDWASLTYGELDLEDEFKFDCADSFGRNTKVNLLESPPAGITNYAAGVEIGCVVTIEIKNTYALNPLGAIPNACNPAGTDFAVVKSGSISANGTISLSPFINMGISVPVALPSKTVWKKAKPLEKSFKRTINVRGYPVPITLTVQVRPKLDWMFEAKAGANVEFATNSLIDGSFNSQIKYSRGLLTNLSCAPDLAGYAFEFKNIDRPLLIPETGTFVVKPSVAGQIEITNNFLFGVGVNLKNLDRVSVTTGLNAALVAKGEVELRDPQLTEKFGASFLEVRSLELIAETSIKASGSAKLFDLDLPWILKPLEILYKQSVELIDQPLGNFTLWRTPHLDLTATKSNDDSYQLSVKGRDDDGVLVGVSRTDVSPDELNWLSHNTNDGFTLTPEAGDAIAAKATFITPPTESFSVALSYLPPIADLSDKVREGDTFKPMLTKYAVANIEVEKPEHRFTKLGGTCEEHPAGENNWGAVRDNQTGLMWKRQASGTYMNTTNMNGYDPRFQKSGGLGSDYYDGGCRGAGYRKNDGDWCDSNRHVNVANERVIVHDSGVTFTGICGYTNWRLPTIDELVSLAAYCLPEGACPNSSYSAIDGRYFLYDDLKLLTSSPGVDPMLAWSFNRRTGDVYLAPRHDAQHIMLVRSWQ